MSCPEFGSVKTVAERLGVSVSLLHKMRLFRPDDSPPFINVVASGKRGRVIYPLTGPNSLETWAAERARNSKGNSK